MQPRRMRQARFTVRTNQLRPNRRQRRPMKTALPPSSLPKGAAARRGDHATAVLVVTHRATVDLAPAALRGAAPVDPMVAAPMVSRAARGLAVRTVDPVVDQVVPMDPAVAVQDVDLALAARVAVVAWSSGSIKLTGSSTKSFARSPS